MWIKTWENGVRAGLLTGFFANGRLFQLPFICGV